MDKTGISTPEVKIVDWFNPFNVDHLRAYKILQDTGAWPKGFLPDFVYEDRRRKPTGL